MNQHNSMPNIIAVTGKTLRFRETTFELLSAGSGSDHVAYATIKPHDDFVVGVILKHIANSRPKPPSLSDIQEELDKLAK
jgi:hypothetical protein